jgi:hydroxypyruvate reductase
VRRAHACGRLNHITGDIALVAAGKAARAMAAQFAEIFDGRIVAAVVAGPPVEGVALLPDWRVIDAAHPDPDRHSVEAGEQALDLARRAGRDCLVVLLSGGASSMLCVPVTGLSLDDKAMTSRALMAAGAPIEHLNCVRKHLSAIKGGRLAAAAGRSATIAVSDVHYPVPDDPAVIGSGPTRPRFAWRWKSPRPCGAFRPRQSGTSSAGRPATSKRPSSQAIHASHERRSR